MIDQGRGPDRLLIIGWDGADWEILDHLIAGGYLPNVAAMVDEGARGELLSTVLSHSWAAWPSFLTGLNPGGHGVYDFMERRPNDVHRKVAATATSIRAATFLERLSHAGHEVRAGNIPVTYPPGEVRGRIISGVAIPPGAPFINPPEWGEKLERRAPFPINGMEWIGHESDPRALVAETRRYIEARTAAFELLLEGNWSVAACVYVAPDRLQHPFGAYLQPSHPDFPHLTQSELAADVRGLFALLDDHLGRLRRAAGPRTTVVLMSDHGFRPINRASNLNRILQALQLQRRAPGTDVVSAVKRSPPIRGLVATRLGQRLKRHVRIPGKFDPRATVAFESTAGGGISVNLRGREADGAVAPEDYDTVRAELRDGLLSFVDPETGVPPVAEVFFREEVFSGPYIDLAPDLVAIPRDLWTFSHADVVSAATTWPSGMHRQMGIVASIGGRTVPGNLGLRAIEDLAPTALSFCRTPFEELDGRTIQEISGHEEARIGAAERADPRRTPQPLTVEQEESISKHLRDLGYIE